MKIALFGHFMYELAVGLRENPENEVHLFLDSATLPTCLRDEPLLHDAAFAKVEGIFSVRERLKSPSISPTATSLLSRILAQYLPRALRSNLSSIRADGTSHMRHFPYALDRLGLAVVATSSILWLLRGFVGESAQQQVFGGRASSRSGRL